VKTTRENLGDNKVRLSVEIAEEEFDRDIEAAFRKIAREVRLPGFRPGKAPRRVLEARIGADAARRQALQDSIPEYLSRAVRENDVDLIAAPDVAIIGGESEGAVRFDATCEVRPEITVAGHAGLRVELPAPTVTDAELDEVVEGERRRHGTLSDVDRPAQMGDHVVVDLVGTHEGDPVPGLNTDDWTYEVGRGWVAPGFDDQLVGLKSGEEVRFTAVPNGTDREVDFSVTVGKVQELVVPPLDDAWVSDTFGEFDTVDQWRESLRGRLEAARVNQMRSVVVDKVTDALAALVDIEAPESMVNGDLQARVQNTVGQFQQQGISLDQWLSATGQDAESFIEQLKSQSVKAVKVDLALRAVAAAEGIDADEVDLEAEYEAIALRVGQTKNAVRRAYESNDAVTDLLANLRKSKALDWLLHNVEFVDATGAALSRDTVLGHEHGPDGGHPDRDGADGDPDGEQQ
jgi:trigger factor